MSWLLFGLYWEKLDNFLFHHLVTLVPSQSESILSFYSSFKLDDFSFDLITYLCRPNPQLTKSNVA